MSLTKPGNDQSRPGKSRIGAAVIAMTLAVSHILIVQTPASAAHEIRVPMGTLTDFSVLAHSLITDTGGTSTFADGVGVWSGSGGESVVGISDGDQDSGGIHVGDEVAQQAQSDFSLAYDYAAAQTPTVIPAELGGQTLKAGVYGPEGGGTALSLGATLTLDADGDKNATFIIQTEGAFGSTATTGNIALIDGAQACNVFFQVAGAVTLGATSSFSGTILAQGAITVGAGTNFSGRAFTGSGDMTLSDNRFDEPTCDGTTVTPTVGLTTTEAGTPDTFTVVLNSEPSDVVTIGVSSGDTTEGTVDTALLTFTTGNWATPQTVTVTGVDDSIDDGDIGYTVILAPATGGGFAGTDPADVEVTNSDDDTVGTTVTPTVGLTTTEAGTPDTFTVVLNSQPSDNVTIGVSSSDDTEGTVSTASLTFTTGDWNVAQTVTVTGVNDAVVDGDVAYSVVLAAATGGDYAGFDPDDVSVTNVDNDPAGITVSPTSGLVTTEAGSMATFTVVLDSQPSADVTIGVSSSDTTEGTASTPSLVFSTQNWATSQTVTVTGVNDSVVDGDVAYSVVLGVATGGDYAGIDPADVAVSNTDDDTVGVTVTPTATPLVTTEAGGIATFTVVLDSQPSADVTIGVSSSDTTEGTVDTALLKFTTVNWATSQTVMVTGVNDSDEDGDVAYSVVLGVATGGDYAGIDPDDVAVVNTTGSNGGDGSVGVVDTTTGVWYLRDASNGQTTSFFYGNPGDFPIVGDWDCDGDETPGLYRQSDGFVYLRNSNTQGVADIRFFFGNPGDIPIVGDFDNDGCDTVSIYRPSEGRAYIINELGENEGGLGAAEFAYFFGNPGDKPFVGDFDNDGVDELGLHRESTGLVYFRLTNTQGVADAEFIYGNPGDKIVAADWAQSTAGPETVGIFRPSEGKFYLNFENAAGFADVEFVYGNSDMLPVAGAFGVLPGGDPGSTVRAATTELRPELSDRVHSPAATGPQL